MSKVARVKQDWSGLPVGFDSFRCPECDISNNHVVDSRQAGQRRRRRRVCVNGHRFTTYELSAEALADIERKLAGFREWQAQTRDLLRGAA